MAVVESDPPSQWELDLATGAFGCINDGRPVKADRRCSACYEFRRRTGRERLIRTLHLYSASRFPPRPT